MRPARTVRTGPYRLLLRLLPYAFRERYGEEMVVLFREALEARTGVLSRMGVWIRGSLDVVSQAWDERTRRRSRGRSPRRGSRLEPLMQDLRFALRGLAKSPGYTLTAVIVLGLGIGANTAIFSLVSALLLRPPAHIEEPDRLVAIFTSDYSGPRYGATSYPDALDFRRGAAALQDVLLFKPGTVSLSGKDGLARIVLAETVSGNYFAVLGVEPILGRAFTAEEGEPRGGAAVAVISHGFWSRELGADPDVCGRTLRLSGQVVTIVGVAPEGFGGSLPLATPDFWLPLATGALMSSVDRLENRGSRGFLVRGRLAPGATLEEAQAQLDVVAARLRVEYDASWRDLNDETRKITVTPSETIPFPQVRGAVIGFTGMIMGVAAMVLLIACANIANLTLARGTRRRHEVAIRLALGAGRVRLVRQHLAESSVVGAAGGSMGVLLALAALHLARAAPPEVGVELTLDLGLDPRVYLFVTLITAVTILAVGLLPALRASRPHLVAALKEGVETSKRDHVYRPRNLLVIGQISASLALLVGAGLFLRSLQVASRLDLGFHPEGVVTMGFDLGPEGYEPDAAASFYDLLRQRVSALPGVASVTVSDRLPLGAAARRRGVQVRGYEPRAGEDMELDVFGVGPEFLSTLGLPLLRGREITAADGAHSARVVMVNRSFAEKFWPGQDAIGKTVEWGRGGEAEVVGVVGDAVIREIGEETRLAFFVPLTQSPMTAVVLSARTAQGTDRAAAALLPLLRQEVQALDPALPLRSLRTYESILAGALLPQRAASWVLSLAGGLGMLLAAVGLYGIMAYLVAQRTRELGVRLALGACRVDVIRLVLGHGLRLVVVGVAVGAGAAAVLGRFLAAFLLGVSPADPWAFALMAIAAALVATLASFVPALRAARIDPAVTLRDE